MDLSLDIITVRTTALSLFSRQLLGRFLCSAGLIECVRVILYCGHYLANDNVVFCSVQRL